VLLVISGENSTVVELIVTLFLEKCSNSMVCGAKDIPIGTTIFDHSIRGRGEKFRLAVTFQHNGNKELVVL